MRSHSVWRAPFVAVMVVAMLALSLLPAAMPASAAASIHLSRSVVPRGAQVTVTGSGFTAGDVAVVYSDMKVGGVAQRVQQGTSVNGSGNFSTTLKLPANTNPGYYTVIAKDAHGVTASTHLSVFPLLFLNPKAATPTVTVIDRQGFFVDGTGFGNAETVKLVASFPTYGGNTIVVNKSATTTSAGKFFGVLIYVPAGVKAGISTLTATGDTSGTKANGRINVVYRPFIFPNTKTVQAGNAFTVNGRGFVANAQVRVTVTIPTSGATVNLAVTAGADGNGSFAKSLKIPGDVSPGTYTVTAVDQTGGFKAYTSIKVTSKPAPKPTATPKPKPTATPKPKPTATPKPTVHASVTLLPHVTLPNQAVTLTGTGFPSGAGISVSLTVDIKGGGNQTVYSGARADSNGSFTAEVKVPKNAAPGTYTVTASGGGAHASDQLQVLPVTAHPKGLGFRYISVWYHVVRQGTWDEIVVQASLKTTLGIWVHVVFPAGQHHDYYTNTNHKGYWAQRFSVPRNSASRYSNVVYLTFQLWHGHKTAQRFATFSLA